ncbi:MAG: hypothetical protein ACTSWA_06820 [Candidatus Thorarchaeota archaeon]
MNRKFQGLIIIFCMSGLLSAPFMVQYLTEPTVGAAAAPVDPLLMTLAIGGAALIAILTAIMWKLKPVPA